MQRRLSTVAFPNTVGGDTPMRTHDTDEETFVEMKSHAHVGLTDMATAGFASPHQLYDFSQENMQLFDYERDILGPPCGNHGSDDTRPAMGGSTTYDPPQGAVHAGLQPRGIGRTTRSAGWEMLRQISEYNNGRRLQVPSFGRDMQQFPNWNAQMTEAVPGTSAAGVGVQQAAQPLLTGGDVLGHSPTLRPRDDVQWHAPSPDASIPTTPAQQLFYVQTLLNAILSVEKMHDRPTPALLRRWCSPSTAPYYSPTVLDALAHRILDFTVCLHTQGSSAFTSHDPNFLRHAARTSGWTLAQRLNRVAEVLSCSKSRCEKLLGGLHVQSVVGNPDKVLKTMRGNVVQNGRRQKVLEAGRQAKRYREGS
ncbi:hypothetical protein ACN47E_008200 [Coniothyrium glycines]